MFGSSMAILARQHTLQVIVLDALLCKFVLLLLQLLLLLQWICDDRSYDFLLELHGILEEQGIAFLLSKYA